jgi:hypothetical protein
MVQVCIVHLVRNSLRQCQEITSYFLRRVRSWFDDVIPVWTKGSMDNIERCYLLISNLHLLAILLLEKYGFHFETHFCGGASDE